MKMVIVYLFTYGLVGFFVTGFSFASWIGVSLAFVAGMAVGK